MELDKIKRAVKELGLEIGPDYTLLKDGRIVGEINRIKGTDQYGLSVDFGRDPSSLLPQLEVGEDGRPVSGKGDFTRMATTLEYLLDKMGFNDKQIEGVFRKVYGEKGKTFLIGAYMKAGRLRDNKNKY